MKPGNIVTLRSDIVVVQLLSDSMENLSSVRSRVITTPSDTTPFRRGEVATVIEINKENTARVKILHRSGMWWGNVSDMLVVE
jgi:F420-0:gamma-glutamyl ligase